MKDIIGGVILVLIAFISGVFADRAGILNIDPILPAKAQSSAPIPDQRPLYKVGDPVQMDGYLLKLENLRYEGTTLVSEFTLDNSFGTQPVGISSVVEFQAKNRDGYLISQIYCNYPPLAGRVLVGDKLRGFVCWYNVIPGTGVKIYHMPPLDPTDTIVWITE